MHSLLSACDRFMTGESRRLVWMHSCLVRKIMLLRQLPRLQAHGMAQVDSDWSLVSGASDNGEEPEIPSEATRTR